MGPIVSAIDKVVVDEHQRGDKVVRTLVSAHDLRQAFGQRWSRKVMLTVLRELMRHTDIATTLKFYVGQNAEATADAIWEASGNTPGSSDRPANKKHRQNQWG